MKLSGFVLSAILMMSGCGSGAAYYRQEVNSDHGHFTYWREVHPTTFHGICANMYGNKEGTLWVVEHPYGVNPVTRGSVDTDVEQFADKQFAEAWAESKCPTKGTR